jgi:signal transduction histidine kinase
MKLGTKLISAFAVIAVLIALSGYLGSSQIDNLYSAYQKEQNEILPALSSLAEIKATLPIIELEPAEYLNQPDEEHWEELEEAKEHIEQSLLTYGRVAGQDRADGLSEELDGLFVMSYEILRLKDAGADKPVLDQSFSQLDDRLDVFDEKLDVERDRITQELGLSAESLSRDIGFTYELTIILAGTAAAIAIAVGVYMSNSISKPIAKLTHAADQIGKGNFEVETSVSTNFDEIGMLCNHFGNMKDQLKNKEKMQNEFLSVASHELRTPIQPILSYADMAGKGIIKPEAALKVIMAEGKRLLQLANDILDITRIEGGRMRYNVEKVLLNEFISEIARSHQLVNASKNPGVQLNLRVDTDPGLSIFVDRTRMSQVMNNIIENAVRFTQNGSVNIETSYLQAERKEVSISVTDTGPGISPNVSPRLFGKFVTDAGTINNRQGSGLGLFISKAIVEAHGGRISGQNNANRVGATFTITLPIHTIEEAKPHDVNAAPA